MLARAGEVQGDGEQTSAASCGAIVELGGRGWLQRRDTTTGATAAAAHRALKKEALTSLVCGATHATTSSSSLPQAPNSTLSVSFAFLTDFRFSTFSGCILV